MSLSSFLPFCLSIYILVPSPANPAANPPAANGVVTIEGESAEPVKAVVTYVVCLAGSFTATAWAADPMYMLMGPDATTGIWEGTYTLPDGEFKLNVFAMYEDYSMSETATWVGASAIETMPEGWSGTDNIVCVAGEYKYGA